MINRLPTNSGSLKEKTPEELLTDCLSSALRQSGFPPLQYLDVETRDGHVYLTARVPELFLARRLNATNSDHGTN